MRRERISPGPCRRSCERGLEVVESRAGCLVLQVLTEEWALLFNVLHHTWIPVLVFGAAPKGPLSVQADHH